MLTAESISQYRTLATAVSGKTVDTHAIASVVKGDVDSDSLAMRRILSEQIDEEWADFDLTL